MAQFDTVHYDSLVDLLRKLNEKKQDCPGEMVRCAARHHETQPRHDRRTIYKRVGCGDELRVQVLCELEHDMRCWEKSVGLTMVATDCSGAAWRIGLDSGEKQLLVQGRAPCCIAHSGDDRLMLCDPLAQVLYIEREAPAQSAVLV